MEKDYWGKNFFGSKLNTGLLLVLIVLMVIALLWMKKDKEKYFSGIVEDKILVVSDEKEKISEIEKVEDKILTQKPKEKTPIKENLISIDLGQEHTYKLNEKVEISNSYGTTFKVTGFFNAPCPPGTMCIWSGLDVFYEIQLPLVKNSDGTVMQEAKLYKKDKPLQNNLDMPFNVIINDSDYKTYAKITLQGLARALNN